MASRKQRPVQSAGNAGQPAVSLPSDDDVLRLIAEGTARATGEEFFRQFVRSVALATQCAYAFVAEIAAPRTRVQTLAVWGLGTFHDNIAFDLDGTPCEDVIRGAQCYHPRDLQQLFPRDRALVEWGAQSYLGVPLLDGQGQVLGHLAVLDTRPMGDEPRRLSVFKIFAARAAAELERTQLERAVRESERRFRDLFDEAPIGYVYEDTHTRFVSVNKAGLDILGLRPEEVVGTVGRTLVAPEAYDLLDESLRAEQTGKEKASIEIPLRRRSDGRTIWIHRFSRPEPDGKHTRTMIIDITERVMAQHERNRLRQQNVYLREEIAQEHNFEEIVGQSASLRSVLGKVAQVAPTDATTLILGETGTGKELIARALHHGSRRRDKPFIKLNCAALPTGLIESELFGHEKGAFTGAIEKRVGRFALADGGTIFLDEIGDVPPDVQVRLLRVLQEHEFEPVGSTRTHRVDVRVVAATNRDLQEAVIAGEFRADLFYRLNVFPIRVPPLRDRQGDVALLAHYFAGRYAGKMGKVIGSIDEATLQRLEGYAWPGNIRELQNVIERAVILTAGDCLSIDASLLGGDADGAQRAATDGGAATAPRASASATTLVAQERRAIEQALRQAKGRIEGPRGAAKALGLHPNTLRSRMKKLGIRRAHEDS